LRNQPVLQEDDVTVRLQRRVHTIAPRAAGVALDSRTPAVEVVRLLGGPA
jgi:hypothetical protein